MKQFWLGVILSTLLWFAIISNITIPEYTVIHTYDCARNTI